MSFTARSRTMVTRADALHDLCAATGRAHGGRAWHARLEAGGGASDPARRAAGNARGDPQPCGRARDSLTSVRLARISTLRFALHLVSAAARIDRAAPRQSRFLIHIWYWVDHDPHSTAFMHSRLERIHDKSPGPLEIPTGAVQPHRDQLQARDHRSGTGMPNFSITRASTGTASRRRTRKTRKKARSCPAARRSAQQLAKNLFLSGERTWWRKAQEAAHHRDDRNHHDQAADT